MSPSASTAPGLLAARAQAAPDEVAFRSKHLGLYRERTWKDYAALVARCARGFQDLGLAPESGEDVGVGDVLGAEHLERGSVARSRAGLEDDAHRSRADETDDLPLAHGQADE